MNRHLECAPARRNPPMTKVLTGKLGVHEPSGPQVGKNFSDKAGEILGVNTMLSLASYLAYLGPHLNRDVDLAVLFKPFGLNIISCPIKDLPTGVLVELILQETQNPEIDPEDVLTYLLDLVDPDALEEIKTHLDRKAS